MSRRFVFVCLAIVLSLSARALTQSGAVPPAGSAAAPAVRSAASPPPSGSVAAEASKSEVAPVLDGRVLDDEAWAKAKVITGFWQTTPYEGQPASENTEVRVMYTNDVLYIGVVNYDRTPELIIRSWRTVTPS